MEARGFGRIVNITSASVKTPLTGLDLSSGARAGLTAFLAGVAREVAPPDVTINNILPGAFDTDRLRVGHGEGRCKAEAGHGGRAQGADGAIPAGRFGTAGGVRQGLRLPVQRPCRLHHRPEPPHRRRRLPLGLLRRLGTLHRASPHGRRDQGEVGRGPPSSWLACTACSAAPAPDPVSTSRPMSPPRSPPSFPHQSCPTRRPCSPP